MHTYLHNIWCISSKSVSVSTEPIVLLLFSIYIFCFQHRFHLSRILSSSERCISSLLTKQYSKPSLVNPVALCFGEETSMRSLTLTVTVNGHICTHKGTKFGCIIMAVRGRERWKEAERKWGESTGKKHTKSSSTHAGSKDAEKVFLGYGWQCLQCW